MACAQIKELQTGEGLPPTQGLVCLAGRSNPAKTNLGQASPVLSAQFLGVSSVFIATEIPFIGAEHISHMFRKTSNMPLKKAGRPLRAALPPACAEKTLGE